MIRTIFRLLRACFVYGSMATVLAQLLLLGIFFARYGISRQQAYETLAVVYEIDLEAVANEYSSLVTETSGEQVAHDEVLQARLEADLDLDLRQQALDMALRDLRILLIDLKSRQERLDLQSTGFEQLLEDKQNSVEQAAILELEQNLQAMQPQQAKEQIIRMLDDEPTEESMVVVVSILKSMPLDKRKKIFAEFRTDEEAERLADILRQIRLGEPDISIIRQTRFELQESEPTSR